MEGGVEHGDVWNAGKVFTGRAHAFQIVRIVQRRKRAERLDLFLNRRIDQYRIVEFLAAVHDSVSGGVDALALHLSEDGCERGFHIRHAFGLAFHDQALGVSGVEIKLQRGTSGVQNEDVHVTRRSSRATSTRGSRAYPRRACARSASGR